VERQQDGGGKEGSMADLETEEHRSWWWRICGMFLGLWSWVLEEIKKTVFCFYFILVMFKIAVIF